MSALRRAILVERRARYADFQGRHTTFSTFMRTTADRLVRRYPRDAVWTTLHLLGNTKTSTLPLAFLSTTDELLAPSL